MGELAESLFELAATLWLLVRHLIAIALIGAVVEGVWAIIFCILFIGGLLSGESPMTFLFLPVSMIVIGLLLLAIWITALLPASVVAGWLAHKRVLSAWRGTLVGCVLAAGVGLATASLALFARIDALQGTGTLAAVLGGAALGYGVLFLIYHGTVHSLGPVVPWLRRAWRRRRGECPECGYAIVGATVCPECGHPVERVY